MQLVFKIEENSMLRINR